MTLRYEIADMAPGPVRAAALDAYCAQARAGVHLIANARREDEARRGVETALVAEQRMLRRERLSDDEREQALTAVADALHACAATVPRAGAPVTEAYDAIVCGGSFGGLAAASQIGGRVLIIDRLEIGDGETSASAVPMACLERMDLLDCVEQVHREIVIHTRRRSQRLRFFDFATFDYRRFCTDLFERTGADFLRARITGAGDGVVHTTKGSFEAPIVIEAAGWRTSAPKGRAARRARAPRKSFGVEARQPYRGDGLHFYVGPSNGSRRFYWIFPAGDHVRAGLATYTGDSALSQDLVDFLERHDLGAARPPARRLLHLAHDRPDPRRHVRGGRRGGPVPAGLGRGDPAGAGLRPARGPPRRAGARGRADPRPGALPLPRLHPVAPATATGSSTGCRAS